MLHKVQVYYTQLDVVRHHRVLTLILPFVTMHSFSGECRARSASTYVQFDLALHSPLLLHYFLPYKTHPLPFDKLKFVSVIIINLISDRNKGYSFILTILNHLDAIPLSVSKMPSFDERQLLEASYLKCQNRKSVLESNYVHVRKLSSNVEQQIQIMRTLPNELFTDIVSSFIFSVRYRNIVSKPYLTKSLKSTFVFFLKN